MSPACLCLSIVQTKKNVFKHFPMSANTERKVSSWREDEGGRWELENTPQCFNFCIQSREADNDLQRTWDVRETFIYVSNFILFTFHILIIVRYKDETQGQTGLIGALIKYFLGQRHFVLLREFCIRWGGGGKERSNAHGHYSAILWGVTLSVDNVSMIWLWGWGGGWQGSAECNAVGPQSQVSRSHSQGYYHYLQTLQHWALLHWHWFSGSVR